MGDQLPSINGVSDDKALLEPSEVQFGSSATTTEANSEMTIADDNTKIMPADAEVPALFQREHWDNPLEFLMSCIAMSVGLGNIWRFPFIAYKNGGGAFLIPYLIVLVLVARPIYFMELCLGQFSSCSQIDVWSCVPLFRGIGFTTAVSTAALLTYYCSINALTVYYFFASFQTNLPWAECDETGKGGRSNITKSNSSCSELYFIKEVLHEKEDISEGIGNPDWKLTMCLLFAWIAISLSLIRGIKSSGKVAYFFTIYPYVVLLVLLGVGCSLSGAGRGIIYFIKPQWEKLLDAKVWFAAITQCFYSLNTGFGSIIMYSSYNKFNHKIYRDSLIISVMDTFTSLLAGFTIFAVLGHLAHSSGYQIEDVVKNGGTSLAFISYPETIASIKVKYVPQFLAVLFFLMLFSLGVGSSVSDAGAIVAIFSDKFPKLAKWKITSVICAFSFLVGLVYVTPGGQAVLELVDFYGASFVIFITTTLEVIAMTWVYGPGHFARDIEFMLNIKIGWYWRLCWGYLIPLALPIILIYSLKEYSTPMYGDVPFPTYALACGWLLALGALGFIPICAFLVLWKMPGNLFERLLASVRSTEQWGPEDSRVRKEWIAYKADHPIQERTQFSKLLTYLIIFVYSKIILFILSL